MWVWVLIALLVVLALLYFILYNSLINLKNKVYEAKASIETVFQNRYDLIPNLIDTVKKYTEHEKSTLEDVTNIRSNLLNNQELSKDRFQKENQLSESLKSIFALSESYPDLKADQNFINLQNQWAEIEDRMQAARRTYNAAVKELWNAKEMIPTNIVAATMNLPSFEMFEADEESHQSLNAEEMFEK